jgi:beta-glucanase (GH16 family)
VLGHPSAAVVYPKHEGFTLALVEEFDAPLDLDHDPVWTWSDGGLTEGGVRFVKDALAFRDGKLVITARNEAAPGSTSFAEAPLQASAGFVAAKALKSGELRTRFNNFRYGRYEARLEPPTSAGNFIATMFVLRTPKFQEWREIDIEVTADRPGGVMTNLIFANNVFSWNASIEDSVDGFPSGPGARPLPPGFANQPQLHTYAFEWIPGRITWLVDDVPVRVTVPGKLPVPERSAKILMNLWVFAIAGGFGGDPTRNTYPLSSEYDWFRFYKWNGDDRYPCAAPPACLPPEDLDRSKNNPDDGLPP